LTGRGGWGRDFNPYTDERLEHNETQAIFYFCAEDGIAPEHPLLISLTQLPHIVGVLGVRFAYARKAEESFHMPMTAKKSKRKTKSKKKRTVRKVGARGAARKTRRKGAKKTARRKTRRSKKAAAAPAAM
jgi:hypothetical protein